MTGPADADTHTHAITHKNTSEGAAACWRHIGATTLVEARAGLLTSLYRRWGATVARANAWLRIRRLEGIGARGRMAQAYADGAEGVDHFLAHADLTGLAPDTGGGFGAAFD